MPWLLRVLSTKPVMPKTALVLEEPPCPRSCCLPTTSCIQGLIKGMRPWPQIWITQTGKSSVKLPMDRLRLWYYCMEPNFFLCTISRPSFPKTYPNKLSASQSSFQNLWGLTYSLRFVRSLCSYTVGSICIVQEWYLLYTKIGSADDSENKIGISTFIVK